MNSELLADALSRAPLPDSSGAVERTVAAARASVGPGRERWRPDPRRALAIVAAALLAIGFVTLTPPGQAAADWVEELIAGGPERNQLGTGVSPGGASYEVRTEVERLGESNDTCIYFKWTDRPEAAPDAFGSCDEGLRTQGPIEIPFIAETEEELLLIGALTNLDASDFRLSYREGPDEPTIEAPLDSYTLEASDLDDGAIDAPRATLVVGFIPETIGEIGGPSSAELAALDAEGDELAEVPVRWVWGGFKGYRTACGVRAGPWEDVCRAAVDEEFRYEEFIRRLTAPEPPPDLLERAAENGIFLAAASREDALSVPVENDPMGTASKALQLASDRLPGGGGGHETYLVRAGLDGRLAIMVYLTFDECRGGEEANCEPSAPWDRELLVLVDAETGEEISTRRLEPEG